MSKTHNIQSRAKVLEALSNSNFRIELENGNEIIGFLSGKMRMHYIKIVPGDTVGIEFSPYDLSKARIYKRF